MSVFQEQKMLFRLLCGFFFLLAGTSVCFGQSKWLLIDPLPQDKTLNSVAYGDSLFVAVGDSGMILTSPNGKTWTIRNSETNYYLFSAIYGNGHFIAVGEYINAINRGAIFTSLNASTWTHNAPGSSYIQDIFYSVIYGKSQFVIAGGYGDVPSGVVLTSSDSATWTDNFPALYQSYLHSITYGYSRFVAIGTGGGIYSSPDAVTWTKRNSTSTKDLNSIIYGDNQFVAVGAEGTILTSPDDSTWTIRNSNTTNTLNSITYGNNQFLIAGDSGRILTSPDAISWTIQNSGTTHALRGIVYADSQFVAVGDSGVILTSKADITRVAFQNRIQQKNIGRVKINIANNGISVLLPDVLKANIYKIDIFTVAGKRIYSVLVKSNDGILTIPGNVVPVGMYYMSISNEIRSIVSSAFMITK
jgi:hypothetical protein